MNNPLTTALLDQFRLRVFEESIPRIVKCLDLLSEDAIWYRPNDQSNSVGNLVLHLEGNARQWVIAGLGGAPDTRQRQQEFDFQGPMPKAELVARLEKLREDLSPVLAAVTDEGLLSTRKVQIYEETGISILVHVIEHFSYHTGQIAYFVKAFHHLDTGFYAGQNL